MELDRISTYKEFWPFYLQEHSKSATRNLHYIGTSLFFVILFSSLAFRNFNFLWLLPVIGYGFAWLGHFLVEKNRPATFKYPLWSLFSDFKMYFFWLSGKLDQELEKYQVKARQN